MKPREGRQVSFVGPGWSEPAQGRLLTIAGSGGHVKWASGPDAGNITLVDMDDLIEVGELRRAASAVDPLADSLEIGDESMTVEAAYNDDEWLFG